jgi:hypothetical protein
VSWEQTTAGTPDAEAAGIRGRKAKGNGTTLPSTSLEEVPHGNDVGAKVKRDRQTWPKELENDALHGLAGDVVRVIGPHTESDPAAILVQTLVCFGSAVGRGPYYQVEGDQHATNLFAAIVGNSSKARKGTSAGRVKEIMRIADPQWSADRVHGGLSSGEGVIYHVRDAQQGDPGVSDKRLMVFEHELSGALNVMQREGNILSRVIRDAWDRGDLGTLTKNNPTRSTGASISIVGHITEEELRRRLDRTEMANGFANRFLFVCAKRSRFLPHGGSLDGAQIVDLGARIGAAIRAAKGIGRVQMDEDARQEWERVYYDLSADQPGLLGALTARAEAQVIRLALLYALLDKQSSIELVHLKAALALWRYCEASVRHVFGAMLGDPDADTILNALRAAGELGLTRTEIRDLFSRNRSGAQLDRALEYLEQTGRAKRSSLPSGPNGGRPHESWVATARN